MTNAGDDYPIMATDDPRGDVAEKFPERTMGDLANNTDLREATRQKILWKAWPDFMESSLFLPYGEFSNGAGTPGPSGAVHERGKSAGKGPPSRFVRAGRNNSKKVSLTRALDCCFAWNVFDDALTVNLISSNLLSSPHVDICGFAQSSKRDVTHVSGIPETWEVFHERKHWRGKDSAGRLELFKTVLSDSHDWRVLTVTACLALMPSDGPRLQVLSNGGKNKSLRMPGTAAKVKHLQPCC